MPERTYQGVTRAVCIGLGGTGLQTIMRLRRLIVERYRSLDNFPIVRFVQIDTDSGSLDNAELKGSSFHRGVDISLKAQEKVHIGMRAADADALRYALRDPDADTPYNHIAEWLPKSVVENAKAIDNGASGIRAVARLAFFHNYAAIKNKIVEAERGTRNPSPQLINDLRLIINNEIDIFIVGSLYGGTGSGTFLDTAYAVQKLYPNAQVYGYLAIEPEGGFDQQANAYAALMELDFYSRNNSFTAVYDSNDPESYIHSNRPPFKYTFLVGRNTSNPLYTIQDSNKLFNLIAQKIALEFSSEFATQLKANRINFKQYLEQNDNHPRPNPQYYLTFGLSEIYCPIDRIIEITAARVSVSLMQFWQAGYGQAPDITSLMLTFYTKYDWYRDINQRLGFPGKKLDAIALEGNNTANSIMTNWVSSRQREINECKTPSDLASIGSQLKNTFRSQFRKVQFGDNDAMRGEWLTKILREVDSAIRTYIQNINDFYLRLLNPHDENFSIDNTQSWVSRLLQDLNDNRRRLEGELGQLGEEKNLDVLESRWRQMDSEIEEENRKFNFLGLKDKKEPIKTICRKYLEETRKAIEHNRKVFVSKQSINITDDLIAHCQTISSKLIIGKNKATEIELKYREIELNRREMNLDELNGEAIFTSQDISDAENALIPQVDRLLNYQQISDELCRALQIDTSLVDLLQQVSVEATLQKMDQVLEKIFSNRIISFGRPVIEAFLDKYQRLEPEAIQRFSQILSMAEPRLPMVLQDPYHDLNVTQRSFMLVGFMDEQTPACERFKTLLSRNQANKDSKYEAGNARFLNNEVTLNEKDRVLTVTEFGVFPLRILQGMQNYRFHYQRGIQQNKPLHIDKRVQFTDFMPPSFQDMERLQLIFFPCLAIGAFGDYSQQKLQFNYWSPTSLRMEESSLEGNWDQCMETIQNDSDLLAGLTEELRDFEDRLDSETLGEPATRNRESTGNMAKIDQFQQYIAGLQDGYNKRYQDKLIGTDGILAKYRRKLQIVVADKSASSQATISGAGTQNILASSVSDDPVVNAEFVNDVGNTNYEPSSEDTNARQRRREEIEQCRKDLEDEIIDQEEYDREVEAIKQRYPV
ncbi:tubulin-like doman-containing protein [Pseudanabaena sp. FACHB-1998]|uniref:tubulin-like doman-containing protein n=1 Tax=Pseudanabaena sp. FACHB-1998 TaxID=2692858 RepID=UPI001681257C|nr:tubulin-like doman-containing protein [Pseudanabaena sp. FACHB-1998]MBD2175676.1 tubulin-like doman-containing protein [Pseudanabaena sp. FACHB-1998]